MKAVLVTILLFLAVVYSGCFSQSNPVSSVKNWESYSYYYERFAENGTKEGDGYFHLFEEGESSFTGSWLFIPVNGVAEEGNLTAKNENGRLLVNFTPGNVDNNLIGKLDLTVQTTAVTFSGEYEHIGFAGVMARGYFTGRKEIEVCGTP